MGLVGGGGGKTVSVNCGKTLSVVVCQEHVDLRLGCSVRLGLPQVASPLGGFIVRGIGLGGCGTSSQVSTLSGSTAPNFPFLVATFFPKRAVFVLMVAR